MSRPSLRRQLGMADAVVIGLGSMIGAGVFVAVGPAAGAAGSTLLAGLAVAASVAYCNAMSSAWLASRYPESGGTYVYGRRRLGPFWGYLAGWAFVVGKLASCAAIALTFGFYTWPHAARPLAVAAVVALVAVNYRGVRRTARATRLIVTLVLVALAVTIADLVGADGASGHHLSDFGNASLADVLRAAAFFFFAFAGYARIATLGEEVEEPERIIPRAILLALAITVGAYVSVAVAALLAVGPQTLASSNAPLLTAIAHGSLHDLEAVVRTGAALASLGVLLSLIAGISRTMLAMGRAGDLPAWLAAVHPRYRVPHHAELGVGLIVGTLVLTTDLRHAIGFSSFTVLGYYAIANASAWTLPRRHSRGSRIVPALGLVGCVVVAVALPAATVIAGMGVLATGALIWVVQQLGNRGARI